MIIVLQLVGKTGLYPLSDLAAMLQVHYVLGLIPQWKQLGDLMAPMFTETPQ